MAIFFLFLISFFILLFVFYIVFLATDKIKQLENECPAYSKLCAIDTNKKYNSL